MTIITHFYNEEYLLPYWLEHHKRIFDHGILIDYNSTDNSVNIIKEICPDWEIRTSINSDFNAGNCDTEVMNIEKNVIGYRIALNITEFLIGDVKKLLDENHEQYLIPAHVMVDSLLDEFTELEFPKESLIAQRMKGIDYNKSLEFFNNRKARSFHRVSVAYATGRHFNRFTTEDAVILWYGYSPFNETTIKRKLQIQTKIPESDKNKLLGREHIVTRDMLMLNFRTLQQHSESLTDIIMPKFERAWNFKN